MAIIANHTGTTTLQMKQAPHGAFYVWPNGHLSYPKALAAFVGRDDLKIIGPHEVETGRTFRGNDRMIVVDHACYMIVTSQTFREVLNDPRLAGRIHA